MVGTSHKVSLVYILIIFDVLRYNCISYSGWKYLSSSDFPTGRTMSLVHDFIIIGSIFRAREGIWFHSAGNTDYMPVIYTMGPKS